MVNITAKVKATTRKEYISVKDLQNVIIQKWQFQKKAGKPRTILFRGAPGIGKTYSVEEAATRIATMEKKKLVKYENVLDIPVDEIAEDAMVLVVLNLAALLPEDFIGLPRVDETRRKQGAEKQKQKEKEKLKIKKTIDYAIQKWIRIAEEHETLLFFDDVGNIKDPAVRTLLYDVAQFHRLANANLRKALIIMASNDAESNSDVEEFSSAFVNRVTIYPVMFSKPVWVQWVKKKYNTENVNTSIDIDENDPFISEEAGRALVAMIIRILEVSDEWLVYQPPEQELSMNPWPSPRSWDALFEELVSGTFPWNQLFTEIAAKVGNKAANVIWDLLSMEVPVDEIINSPEILNKYTNPELVFVAAELGNFVVSNWPVNEEAIYRIAEILYQRSHEIFINFMKTLKTEPKAALLVHQYMAKKYGNSYKSFFKRIFGR